MVAPVGPEGVRAECRFNLSHLKDVAVRSNVLEKPSSLMYTYVRDSLQGNQNNLQVVSSDFSS